ncbi:hypothetical protein CENSYa_1474 [Cenarchaeum symbiosum A]|uniref:Trypsin-like serine protease n=1 Tax=Cenarchaeum symbiosum (strain A) TaxID=414004 RepID=A0RXM9_CENSY|nr:hypothetical protein CENSYa_1474 [Cenarchaeum symbiosum A]
MKDGEFLQPYVGSVTIGARNQSHSGIVVAAHSIEEKTPGEIFHMHNITSKEYNSTKFLSGEHGMLRKGGNVDVAFIPITASDVTIGSKVRAHNGTVTEVAWGRLADVERGQHLTAYGWFNNGLGNLMFKNVTEFHGGITFRNMGISEYETQTGDSGSAIVYHGGDTATLVGVHRGSLCMFDAASEGFPQVDVSGSSLCRDDPLYRFYKIFSAWENVEDSLNLVRPG